MKTQNISNSFHLLKVSGKTHFKENFYYLIKTVKIWHANGIDFGKRYVLF